MKNSVLVLGSFGYHNGQLDGQTIKTRQVYQLLKERYDGRVDMFCSMTLRTRLYRYFVLLWKIFEHRTIIMLYPAAGGFRTMLPVVFKLCRFFCKRTIYIAIGSAQVDCMEGVGAFTKPRKDLMDICRNMNVFLAETKKVQNALIEKYNFKNVDLFPNFRYFDKEIAFSPASRKTLRLVFMARITPKKGYDTVFEFFESIKGKGYDITADFYGPMDGECNEAFLALIEKYRECGVNYKGILQPDEIHKTLQEYDVLVFPTLVDGIPGSIIDAYIASLVIVATNWEYAHEIIEDNVNGFIVPYDNPEKQKVFNERLIQLYNDRDLLGQMKMNAYQTREKYSAQAAWGVLRKYL